MIPEPVLRLAAALLLTLAAEAAAAGLLGVRDKLDFLLIVAANTITNPLVNVLAAALRPYAAPAVVPGILLLEAAAVFAECALYRKLLAFRRIPPLRFSLILNAASFLLGVLWLLFSP